MATPAASTRQRTACAIFGTSDKLPLNVLPTYKDVMKHYLQIKGDLKFLQYYKDPPLSDILEILSLDIENVWTRACIPTVSHTRVIQILRDYHAKYMMILKPYNDRKDTPSFKIKVDTFLLEADKLMDICACKCKNVCTCVKSRKVPVNEIEFLKDQRTCRRMIIGSIDARESKRLKKLHDRKESERRSATKRKLDDIESNVNVVVEPDSANKLHDRKESERRSATKRKLDDIESNVNVVVEPDSANNNEMNQPDVSTTPQIPKTTDQMRVKLPSLAQACDRFGVSDRAAATIASAVLHDVGVITTDDVSSVVDRSKVRRERIKTREIAQNLDSTNLSGLYFDGRKDKTSINILEKDGKYHKKKLTEEHICIISEPGSKYFAHVTPAGGSSKDITRAITECIRAKDVDIGELCAIGCDGTNVNTGHIGGVIRLLELHVDRPLQWFVCLLHANELPLRHLFETLDGKTSGPCGFSGPIGKALVKCEDRPIKSYTTIAGELPQVNPKDLSTDQKYLHDICKSVHDGDCPIDLSLRNPGTINHSRWVTTANRLMRLYVSCDEPSDNLVAIATFIMQVYAPMWFRIKSKPSCKDGARHLYETIAKSRYLSKELKEVVDPVIQRNAYFGHPENVLLSMITDEEPRIRELGLRRILEARSSVRSKTLRKFKTPVLNFEAAHYADMVDWTVITYTEPPILKNVSNSDLQKLIREPETPVKFDRYPCHTQAVERGIKLVTESSLAVCSENSRDGFIRNRQNSREIMPKCETKSHYKFSM